MIDSGVIHCAGRARADCANCTVCRMWKDADHLAEMRRIQCAISRADAQKRGPALALCGSRARNCCFELLATGTRCSRCQTAFDSEAGGGRLRRPAGQSQVKPPRWLEHMSIKDHLLPTKGPGKADLESQKLRQISIAL
jgi:hypothetical protein